MNEKKNQRKINIYLKDLKGFYRYESSTNWSKTCKEAKAKFLEKENYLHPSQVKTSYK